MGIPLRILIIEDNEDDVILVIRALQKGGFDPTYERVDTADAMSETMRNETWDIVISDNSMPHFSGLAALKLYQEKGLDIPFVIVSGTIGEDAAADIMVLGAHDYVMKDNLSRLVPAVQRELREAESRRERKRTEIALHASEARFRELFLRMSSGVAIYEAVDNGGDFIFKDFNPAAEKIDKVSREDILGKRVSEAFPGVKAFGVFEVFQRVWQTGKSEYFPENIYKDERNPGAWRENWVFKLPTGEIVAIYNDIAERKKAEEMLRTSLREKEVMLREIHHRVKNNMQVISSLFNLQSGHTTNEECRKILKEGQTRIQAMSLVHEKLYKSRDLSRIDLAGYIQSLVVHLFHFYNVAPGQIRSDTEFEEMTLDINSANPCGLILNELISNALKHAFPNGRTGVIKIGLRRGTGGAVELRVADDGIGFPKKLDFRQAESFGLQMVNLLVDQLNATLTLDRDQGTVFTVTFQELEYAPRI